jgi:adenosylcobyric acid synthase
MPAKLLMVQGTSSSVGKSLLTAALCRSFARQGARVAPFKAQNMSNNAAVCADGAEIGRAQALQAIAAGIEPTADLNPILLKPEADSRSQVVVLGKAWRTLQAGSFYRRKEELWPVVTGALDRLRSQYDLIIIEGAGSPVELNLRPLDVANMALALHAKAPVLLVGDIDRGGVFAQLLGTLWLLAPAERKLVRGLVVNKFRGDPALFQDGVRMLEERGGAPVLGVVPHVRGLNLPEEDAVALETVSPRAAAAIDIAVIKLPHIANFDDFDPLRAAPGVAVRFVQQAAALGSPHAVILPGTKSTIADLLWLREQGLATAIGNLAERGTAVVGICGGYQMLGRVIRDAHRVESDHEQAFGLGLLPVWTNFASAKSTSQVHARITSGPGWIQQLAGQEVTGYEIHMGRTQGCQPWLEITRRADDPNQVGDGAASPDGRIWGCYLHGLFANAPLRRLWLASLMPAAGGNDEGPSLHGELDRLANAVEGALDMPRIQAIIDEGTNVAR